MTENFNEKPGQTPKPDEIILSENALPIKYLPGMKVKFSAGFWRLQKQFDYKTTIVRDKEFVLGEKIDRNESNGFEYLRAAAIGENCYGKNISDFTYVVARYGKYYAYGHDIASARAFLGILLYDKHKNIINKLARIRSIFITNGKIKS